MKWRRRDRIADALERTNAYLALIAEVIQKPEEGWRSDGWYLDRIEKAIRERPSPPKQMKAELPISVTDVSELLARWLWLQLPEESKKDLMP